MSEGTPANLPDLINLCVHFDVFVCRDCKTGVVGTPPHFVYLGRREGEERIVLTTHHVSLEHLSRHLRGDAKLAAAVDGTIPCELK